MTASGFGAGGGGAGRGPHGGNGADGDLATVVARGTAVALPVEAPGLDAGPPPSGGPEATWVDAPRLARTRLTLADGREVGVAIAGKGVPLVVVHGFAGEGILYAQTLSRLVGMGFLVVAIDSPGHGATDALTPLAPLDASVALIASAVEALGIRRAVLVGHSMGGRLVAELAAAGMRATGPTMTSPAATRLTATRPATEGRSDGARSASSAFGGAELAIAAVLVDAIVGDLWDRMNAVLRVAPAGYAVLGAALVVDTVSTLPTLSDPRQAVKLARLVFPTGANHVRRPWRLLGPLASIMRAAPSGDTLDRLSAGRVPVFVIHGERDMPVPVCTARSAALRAGADLVVVRGARHSWLLRDPATFPAILAELLRGRLGEALRVARDEAGIGPDASLEAVQAAFCEPGALVADLSPGLSGAPHRVRSRRPRYRWTTRAAAGAAPASNVARDGVATAAGDVEPSGDSPHGHGDLGCGC